MKPKRQRSRQWKKRVQRERTHYTRHPEKAVCWICGDPIDMQLPPQHPKAFSLDHVIPLARGGDENGEARPAHITCNSSRGDGRKLKHQPTLLTW